MKHGILLDLDIFYRYPVDKSSVRENKNAKKKTLLFGAPLKKIVI